MRTYVSQKGLRNSYCDSLKSFLFQHFPLQEVVKIRALPINDDEDRWLCEYSVIKNLFAGVRELNLGCKYANNAIYMLDKYGLSGNAVVQETIDLPEITDRVIFHVVDVLAYSENELQDIALKLGRSKVPVMITYGRSLNEMGSIDKEYGQSPATFLESLGFLDRECFILGGNYLDKDDLMLLASYDAKIIVSPRSDMLVARGFINLSPLVSQNIEILFASDEYPEVDMISEVELGCGQTGNLMTSSKYAEPSKLVLNVLKEKLSIDDEILHRVIKLDEDLTKENTMVKLRYYELEKKLIKIFKEKLWK